MYSQLSGQQVAGQVPQASLNLAERILAVGDGHG